MRSHAELLEASGYASRPRILTTCSAFSTAKSASSRRPTRKAKMMASRRRQLGVQAEKYYQLTHDYLVPSLRDWLTRKQKETRRGRAELLLADRAAVWNARPENRQLPSLWQWLQYPVVDGEEELDAAATEDDGARQPVSCGAGVGWLASCWPWSTFAGLTIRDQVEEKQKATHAAGLVQAVLNADTAQVPDIVGKWPSIDQWTDPLLREEYDKAADNSRQKLHASLALLPVDASQVDYLYGRLLDAAPHEVPVIRDALAPHQEDLLDKLWTVVETAGEGQGSTTAASGGGVGEIRPGEREVGEGRMPGGQRPRAGKRRVSWASGARRFSR